MVRTGGRWKRTFRNLASGLPVCVFKRLWKRIRDTRHLEILPPGFLEYLEYEVKANVLRVYNTNLICGLFQTEAYADTIISTTAGSCADRFVADRMNRKAIFEQEHPPHTFLILDEGIIRRIIGSKEIMREQLAYLLEIGQRERTQLQIVPYSAGYYAGLTGNLTILGFSNGSDVAYTESSGEGLLLVQHDRVALQAVTWELIQGHTLSVEESLAMIREAMEQL